MDTERRESRWRVITRAVLVTVVVMSAGFMVEKLFFDDWEWWHWGFVSLTALIVLIVFETWPWFRSSPNRGLWRQAHREAVGKLREFLTFFVQPENVIAIAYLSILLFVLAFLVAFFSGRPLAPGLPYWGQP